MTGRHKSSTVPILLRLIWNHPANRGRRIASIAKAVGWQFYKRTVKRPFNLNVYPNIVLRAYPDSEEVGRAIYFRGLPDYSEMIFMKRYLRAGDRFVDGGAHVGMYTLFASYLVGAGGAVDAFEPAPLEAERLLENIALNQLGNVRVHQAALGDRPGLVSFTTHRGAGNRIQRKDDLRQPGRTVRMTTLDEALTGAYTMGKLDLEGAELLALSGADEHLASKNPPVWMIELVDRFLRRFGGSALEVVERLTKRGYELATFDVDRNVLQVGVPQLLGTRPNFLAVDTSGLDAIEARLAASIETPTFSGRRTF